MICLKLLPVVAKEPSVASVVLSGLAIVFGMLLLFVFVFSLFGVFSNTGKNKRTKSETKPAQKPVKPVKVNNPAPVAIATDDDELIAVISAAVYAMYDGTNKTPIIRSIRPVRSNGRSAWATAGLMNNIKSF